MIARNVTMRLKANSVAEFTQTLEKEIIPLLRRQKGFQDEITFTVPGAKETVGISFWDTQENADAYSRGGYQKVPKAPVERLDGKTPGPNRVVVNFTVPTSAVPVAAQHPPRR